MSKFQRNAKSIIRAFSPFWDNNYEKMVLLECAVDSERNDVNNYVVSCSVAELFIH